MLAFQCRNPIHKAHYELFIRALDADNVGKDAVCLVHPTCGPTQVRGMSKQLSPGLGQHSGANEGCGPDEGGIGTLGPSYRCASQHSGVLL